MKKFLAVLVALILFGCAGTMPEKADLTIEIANQTQRIYPASLKANIIGRDQRSERYTILYQVGNEPAVKLQSRVPPQELTKESLERGLRQQGLDLRERANIAVVIVIKKLLAKVTRANMLYSANVRTHLQLIVGNGGSTLTLDFDREAKKDSLTRPNVLDLEMMLNDQLSDILKKILADNRVQSAIKGKS